MSSPPANRSRNWLELPPELMITIFQLIGAFNVIRNARKVCKMWRQIGSHSEIWRVLDIKHPQLASDRPERNKLVRKAVEMSCGQLAELSIELAVDDELLNFIADRSSQLRCLRLVDCIDITICGFSEMVKKLPFLENLQLYRISTKAIEVAGQYCPKLKSFEMNIDDEDIEFPDIGCDADALAIAENMPGLCHLQLFGNRITRNGVLAILEKCPNLESLDIRLCSHTVNLGPNLLERLSQQIKYLKLTDDGTEDCELDYDTPNKDSISDDDDSDDDDDNDDDDDDDSGDGDDGGGDDDDDEDDDDNDYDDSEDSDDKCRCQSCLVTQEIWNKWTETSS